MYYIISIATTLLMLLIVGVVTYRVVFKSISQISIKPNENWKIDYLNEIYPLITNPTLEQYDKLECFITSLLPKNITDQYSENVYKALLPGPSCSELPCDCDMNKVPNVSFAPNPMLDNKWPPCNVKGEFGEYCCSSPDAYKKCYQLGLVEWGGNDTWTGNFENTKQRPPSMNQLWKPSLWPKYTLAVNKYPPNNWNSFYNAEGDPDDYWMECLHSSFSINTLTYGVWFYRAIGSGMFVNLGKTFAGLNKLDVIFKLGYSPEELADFIMREYKGLVTDVGEPSKTGLGGLGGLDYWLAGQYHTNLEEYFRQNNLPPSKENLVKLLKTAAYGTDYDINRIVNTGMLDNLIVWLGFVKKYNSIQFTCQSNLYNGFTTEVMILGTGSNVYTDIRQIPKSQFRVLDPNNLPNGSDTNNIGKACTYDYPFTCVYCKEAPATMNEKMGCTVDVSGYSKCSDKNETPVYHSINNLGILLRGHANRGSPI